MRPGDPRNQEQVERYRQGIVSRRGTLARRARCLRETPGDGETVEGTLFTYKVFLVEMCRAHTRHGRDGEDYPAALMQAMVDEPAWSVAWEQLKKVAAVMHMTPAEHLASFFQDEQGGFGAVGIIGVAGPEGSEVFGSCDEP